MEFKSMSTDQQVELDTDELVQLASLELKRGQPGQALAYLKLAVDRGPEHAVAHFMLGVLHSGLGLVDRGINEIERALEIQPDLHIARVRLGLLLLQQGRVDECRECWEGLEDSQGTSIAHLTRGVLHFAEGRREEGWAEFEAGIAADDLDPELREIMQQVLDSVKDDSSSAAEQFGTPAPVAQAPPGAANKQSLAHYLEDYDAGGPAGSA
jgi:tetratricopeptide (TPR) repeat protein